MRWESRMEIWDYLLKKDGSTSPSNSNTSLSSLSSRSDVWSSGGPVVQSAIEVGDLNLMTYLLERKITAWIYPYLLDTAASSEKYPWKLLEALLETDKANKAGGDYSETDLSTTLLSLLANSVADGQLIVQLCTRMTVVTVDCSMLLAIAENRERGAELLQTLFGFNMEVLITTFSGMLDVIKTAISNGNPEVLKLLFAFEERFPYQSEDDFGDIVAGAAEEHFLDDIQNKYTTIARTNDVLDAKVPQEYWDIVIRESVRLLLEHGWADGSYIEQILVEEAALIRGRRVIEFLFDRVKGAVRVTREMVVAAVRNTVYGHNLLEFLLCRVDNLGTINNDVVRQTAAAHATLRTMKLLLRTPQENTRQSSV
jgi:hypothetical protein